MTDPFPYSLSILPPSLVDSGQHDYPAIIDYIIEATGYSKIYFSGMQQAAASIFMTLSLRPEYNEKVHIHTRVHIQWPASVTVHRWDYRITFEFYLSALQIHRMALQAPFRTLRHTKFVGARKAAGLKKHLEVVDDRKTDLVQHNYL